MITIKRNILFLLMSMGLLLVAMSCGETEPGSGDSSTQTPTASAEQNCEEDSVLSEGGTFDLNGKFATKGMLSVNLDLIGFLTAETVMSDMFLLMDVVHNGTTLEVTAQPCSIGIPPIPLPGQEYPVIFELPDSVLESIEGVEISAQLDSANQNCTGIDFEATSIVLGANLSSTSDPLPRVEEGEFNSCGDGDVGELCSTTTAIDCVCDQEGDSLPGVTVGVSNIPLVSIDQAYVSLKTTLDFSGIVHNSDAISGEVTSLALEQSVLGCSDNGTLCAPGIVAAAAALNPAITQSPETKSLFNMVRVDTSMTCVQLLTEQGSLFPQ